MEDTLEENSDDGDSFWSSVGTYLRNRFIVNTIFGKAEEVQQVAGSAPAGEVEPKARPSGEDAEQEKPETEPVQQEEDAEEETPESTSSPI